MEEGITPRILRNELNSEAFVSGLDAIIGFSKETGREAAFSVEFLPVANSFIYPDKIHAGDKTSVGGQHLAERAMSKLSEKIDVPKFMEKFRKVGTKVKNMSNFWDFFVSEFGDNFAHDYFAALGEAMEEAEIPFPNGRDFADRSYLNQKLYKLALANPPYAAIEVYTHPAERIICPSDSDLRTLNCIRRQSHNQKKHSKSEYLPPNAICIAVGTNDVPEHIKIKQNHPLLIMQEQTKDPLPENTDFKRLADGFYALADKRTAEQRLLMNILRLTNSPIGKEGKELGREAKGSYRISNGLYAPDEKRISLCGRSRWPALS